MATPPLWFQLFFLESFCLSFLSTHLHSKPVPLPQHLTTPLPLASSLLPTFHTGSEVGGIQRSVPADFFCRLDWNDPPTAVGGIQRSIPADFFCRLDLNDPPT